MESHVKVVNGSYQQQTTALYYHQSTDYALLDSQDSKGLEEYEQNLGKNKGLCQFWVSNSELIVIVAILG